MKTLLLCFFILSCARIDYVSKGRESVTLGAQANWKNEFTFHKQVEFYFFSQVPHVYVVDLSELAKEVGAKEIGILSIREHHTPLDHLFNFLSFGLYYSRHIEVTGVTP